MALVLRIVVQDCRTEPEIVWTLSHLLLPLPVLEIVWKLVLVTLRTALVVFFSF